MEHGELVHRGPLVSLGYWRDEERTRERFRPSPQRDPGITVPELAVWSGDIVYRDAEGFLYFVGRRDEMIKTSGYRVSPTEIEEVVYATGMVRDAVALGREDPRLGQQIVLVVTAAAGVAFSPEALLARLKQQLPLYMVPSTVLVRAELPRSPNGKFDRNLIRQEVQA
jgi:acyl-CoA synthetase (AMP-forming)/AMP-acid ligase II